MGVAVEDKHHDFDGVSVGDLSSARERSSILLTHAEPIMENLREQIENTRSMVILTDPSGLILKSTGDDDFMSKASRVALRAGVSWDEHNKGTNAIGTSLAEEQPVTVRRAALHRGQYFPHLFGQPDRRPFRWPDWRA
jgi:transcriptional regulator of acetoin/glycerol metabolism